MVTIDGDIIKVEYAPVAKFVHGVSPIIRRQLEDVLTGKTDEDLYEEGYTDACTELRKEIEHILKTHTDATRLTHAQILELFDKAVAKL